MYRGQPLAESREHSPGWDAAPRRFQGTAMNAKTVRDVLGEPESWPNSMNGDWQGIPNMKGATIWDVIAAGNEVAVQTKGAVCGPTFTVFIIEDRNLRERTVRALKLGAPVREALAAPI